MNMDQIKRVYDYIEHIKQSTLDETEQISDDFSDSFELRNENQDIDELIYVKLRLSAIKNESLLLKKEKQTLTDRLYELEKKIFAEIEG